jgi:hypothetical protein
MGGSGHVYGTISNSWATATCATTASGYTWGSDTTSTAWMDCSTNYGKFKVMKGGALYSVNDLIDDVPSKITAGKKEIELPDGAKLIVDDLGNYRIEDKDAKVTYRANRVREFSPHLNASDLVAQFVEYVGGMGLKRQDVLNLPLQLFIHWLVIAAAERDSDDIPADIIPVRQHPRLKAALCPKCLSCGRFVKRLHVQHRFPFCSVEHGAAYVERRIQPRRIEGPSLALAQ